ncbi:MAG: cation-transporting P-type ATPase [Candidatus Rokubacteria bacterium]|nr:cation-transporting P-type ATPase [Candidatus Rokubacteria bacterium]
MTQATSARAGVAQEQPPPFHALGVADVLAQLAGDAEHGLDDREARRRLVRDGPNRVASVGEPRAWRLVARQFRSLVVLLLLVAAILALALGERAEAITILAALLLNAALGFASEWRARVSLARLRELAVPEAVVRRDGHVRTIAASGLVPGDIVVLAAGARVPADARLVRSARLSVTEAALTGESAPVDKDAAARVEAAASLAERRTMVHVGTAVVAGRGLAVVTATGDHTELGRIGQLVRQAGDRMTPLERQVETLGRRLIVLALAVSAVVGAAGVLHGERLGLMVETAITLAIAAIPEGLPAIVAVALAGGLWRLARVGALVRRLPAVETLGATTVICADKTGTMTENRMTVARVALPGRTIVVHHGGDPRRARFVEGGAATDPRADAGLTWLLTVAALANDAGIEPAADGWRFHGDPLEAALLVTAVAAGLEPATLARRWPRHREVPFSSEARMMATLNGTPEGRRLWLVKGAPGVLIARSTSWQDGAVIRPLDEDGRARLLEQNRLLAEQGFRILAVAWRENQDPSDDRLEALTFLGLVALADPVRAGVAEAIAHCREAGVRIIMLTGDQRSTAESVGRQLGLPPAAIRSRVSPEDKLEMVRGLQAEGEVVAMTGDGVNDAPALARADIGVAMGRHGTDVARDAADLVLTDDNFATIVRAIAEGRVIYANLRKVTQFLFSCNLSEILAIFVAIVAGFPAPLLPLQILWVNLVTDILPAVALIRDPAEPDVMRRPPRDPRRALVTWRSGGRIVVEGALLAAGVLSAYFWTTWQHGAGARANTVAFLALVLIHPLQALHCRSTHAPAWRLPSNPLIGVSVVTLALGQWAATSWPPLSSLLGTVAVPLADWFVVGVAVLWPVILFEILKAGRARG